MKLPVLLSIKGLNSQDLFKAEGDKTSFNSWFLYTTKGTLIWTRVGLIYKIGQLNLILTVWLSKVSQSQRTSSFRSQSSIHTSSFRSQSVGEGSSASSCAKRGRGCARGDPKWGTGEKCYNTIGTAGYRKQILDHVGTLCRGWKKEVKRDYYKIWSTDEDRLANPPCRVLVDQWKTLVAYWGTDDAREMAEKNKACRAQQGQLHRTGRRSFHGIIHEKNGERTDRISVYIRTRTGRNGVVDDEETA